MYIYIYIYMYYSDMYEHMNTSYRPSLPLAGQELLLPLARAVFADHDRFVNASARAGATRVSHQSLH